MSRPERGGAEEPLRVAFVCVENAGRSQIAAALAERERDRRGLDGAVEVRSGGTAPAENVHDVVVRAMAELDVDISGRRPREIPREELLDVDVVVTMGCSADDVCPATWRGDARDWGLDDPADRPLEEVRGIRDEIAERVADLFDEMERGVVSRA
ncbi:MAG: low molecular weight phosphatase family protein [Haloarculaceae archaeon]